MLSVIPRWVYAGAAAGLLALGTLAIAPHLALAGLPYKRSSVPPTVVVVGDDGGVNANFSVGGTLDATEIKTDAIRIHTPGNTLNVVPDAEFGGDAGVLGNLSVGDTLSVPVASVTIVSAASAVVSGNTITSGLYVTGSALVGSGAYVSILGRCDERGNTTFPQTCDQIAGLSTIAGSAGATPFDINNALVLSDTAICSAHLTTQHAGCTNIYCVASAGKLTFQTNANCTTTSQDFTWTLEHVGESP